LQAVEVTRIEASIIAGTGGDDNTAVLRRPLIALVAAEAISSLGTLMAVVALPWFVLETTGSAQRMSVVLAAEAAPLALLALVAGRAATRLGARRTMLACDALWAPATAAIPLLHWAGALSFRALVALAFVTGIPAGAHFGAQSAFVAELLGAQTGDVAKANALFQTASRLTYFVGPAVGGALLAAVGAPAVMLADAATFAVSFALVAAFVPGGAERAAVPAGGAGEPAPRLGDGLGLLRRDRVLRPLTAAQFLSQAAFMAMNAAVPVLAFTRYGRDPALAGLLLGVWGGGAMAGGIAAYRLVGGREPLRLGALAWALQAAPLWALAAAPPPAVAICALGLSGLGNGIRVPPLFGVMTVRIPAPLRAGTMAVSYSFVFASGFLALLAAGPVLDRAGAAPVFAAVAALQTLAAALVLRVAMRPRRFPAARRGPRRRGSSATLSE
jgi:predicted MFS family arabinose efflux permease